MPAISRCAENRLTTVWTSRDKIYWERDAAYWYYKHGPLARMELGHLRVQGVDYAYTLQGWLKGINTTALTDGSKDMGQDGYSSGANSNVARDVLGFALHYFDEVDGSDTWLDYTAINGTSAFARPDATTGFKSLYNGNIGAISMNNAGLLKGVPANTNALPLFYKYRYDQLNRLVNMQAYEGLNTATNQWSVIPINDYAETITYDPNGNIKTYNRKGAPKAGQPLEMDALTYHYGTGGNRLSYVQDPTPAGNYSQAGNGTVDIDGQSAGNYGYDANGNLISDAAENINAVSWSVYGKITSVTKGSETIVYSYDAAGNRIIKAVGSTTTIYVRDVSGNVLSLYEKPTNEAIQQKELHLYGSKRIGIGAQQLAAPSNVSLSGGFGMATKVVFVRNIKAFELSNHLGNVLVTLYDKKMQETSDGTTVSHYAADMATANDYYPFGMLMPGRNWRISAIGYRYGFNSQEKSSEISVNTFTATYWQYDARLARRWNRDPKPVLSVSDYAVYLNNPIFRVDILGDSSAPTSTMESALSRINELGKGLKQSPIWKNVTPSDFINDMISRVNHPAGLNQGKNTNFCWAAACMSYVYESNPLGMVEAMFNAYTSGEFIYNNGRSQISISNPSSNIANEPGRPNSSFNENTGLENKADQILLLMLGGAFEGYSNTGSGNYESGDQKSANWGGGVLSKAKDLWSRFGYNVTVYGNDAIGWANRNKGGLVMNALSSNKDVVLFVNSGAFKKNQWYKSIVGTHYIRIKEMTSSKNAYNITYWDYGQWHPPYTIGHYQFSWSTFGMITIDK